jgi:hypothetical protein
MSNKKDQRHYIALLFLKGWRTTVVQLVKLLPTSLEREGPLPSQNPAIRPCPEPVESRLHHHTQQNQILFRGLLTKA